MRNALLAGAMLLALAWVPALIHARPDSGGGPTVTITDKGFSPDPVKIKAGETITWTNAGDHDHAVAANDGSFTSGNLGPGQSFSQKFTTPGKFPYADSYHPRLRGTVIVE